MFEVKRKRWRILALFEANVWLNTSREDSVGMVIKKRSCYFLSTFVSVCFSHCAGHSYTYTHMHTRWELSLTRLATQRSHHRIWHKRTTQRRPELCITSSKNPTALHAPHTDGRARQRSKRPCWRWAQGQAGLPFPDVLFTGGIFTICRQLSVWGAYGKDAMPRLL